ncbi:MAG: phosphoglucosamine mutase, partial [Alphaproteobacteria bacterium]|nr:phosphoglucosamine mutase [Alphaproteobacteria bacterium]
ETPRVKAAMAEAEALLGEKGRLVVRKSGTEPLIRVMAEGEREDEVAAVVDALCDVIREVAA